MKVLRVVDGDTLVTYIDCGFHIYTEQTVRLLGVDAPEMRGSTRILGMKSKLFVQAWIDQGSTSEWPFLLKTYKDDSFGRMLGVIWRISDGQNLNEELLTAQEAIRYNPSHGVIV